MQLSKQETSNDLISQPPEIKRQMFANSQFSANVYATESDVWVGHYFQLNIVPAIHQINPNVICLLYRNIRLVWAPGSFEYNESEYDLFVRNDWILRGSSGEYVNVKGEAYMVDVGNPSFQTWLANLLKNYIDTYQANGVFLDNCFPNDEIAYSLSEWPINPRTERGWLSDDFTKAVTDLVNRAKDTISPKLVVGNTILTGTHFFREDLHESFVNFLTGSKIDGVLSELWISSYSTADWYSETEWKQGVDMAVWIETNFLSKGNKIFWTMSDNAGVIWPEGHVLLPSGVTSEQYVTYCYASRLLAVNHTGNWLNFGLYTPEDYPQKLFKIDIGYPSSAYYHNDNLYLREFSGGLVIVNPTYSNQSVALNGVYRNAVEGDTVSSYLTVPPHVGIILEKA